MVLLHQFHLMFLALWCGVVITESVIELMGRRHDDLVRPTAILHFWIDILIEAPIILMVAVSGLILLLSLDNLSRLHALKISCGIMAICANLYCISMVVRRYKLLQSGADTASLKAQTNLVFLSAIVGMPIAIIAALLGFFLTWQRFQSMGM